jgi:hypothetical protein
MLSRARGSRDNLAARTSPGGHDRGRDEWQACVGFPTGVAVSAAHLCAGSEPARLGHHAGQALFRACGQTTGTTFGMDRGRAHSRSVAFWRRLHVTA